MTKFTALERIKNELRWHQSGLDDTEGDLDINPCAFRPNFDDINKLVKAYEDLVAAALHLNAIDLSDTALTQLTKVLGSNHKLLGH